MKTCIVPGCNQPCEKGYRYCHRHYLDRRKMHYYRKKNQGIKYRTTYSGICLNCGCSFEGVRKSCMFCSDKCMRDLYKKFDLESNNNYIHVKGNQENNILEHRKLAETLLDRKLGYNEVVHHLNGKSKDNDPSNLIILSRSDHGKLHSYLVLFGARLEKFTNMNIIDNWQELILPLTQNILENSKINYIRLSDPSTYNTKLSNDDKAEIKLSMSLEEIARQYIFDPNKVN